MQNYNEISLHPYQNDFFFKKVITPNADEDEKKLNHLFNAGRNTKYK